MNTNEAATEQKDSGIVGILGLLAMLVVFVFVGWAIHYSDSFLDSRTPSGGAPPFDQQE